MRIEEVVEYRPTLSQAEALEKFRKWLDDGLFVEQGLSDMVLPQVQVIYLPFGFINANASTRWSAVVGKFDTRDWERDYENYRRAHAKWVNSGRQGREPRQPDRENYYEWYDYTDRWDCSTSLCVPAFDTTLLNGSTKLFKAAQQAADRFNDRILGNYHLLESDVYGTADNQIIQDNMVGLLNKAASDHVQAEVNRFDRYRNLSIEHLDIDAECAACYLAFYKVEYTHKGKNYTCLVDAVAGEIIAGPRPRDSKKIGIAVAIAAAVIALGVAFVALRPEPSPTPVPASVPAASEEVASPQETAAAASVTAAVEEAVSAETEAANGADDSQAFLRANRDRAGVITTPSGLQLEVLARGDGPAPSPDDMVTIEYVGRLSDGTLIASTQATGNPERIQVKAMIPGLTEGLQLMQLGDKYRFFLPPELGFGPEGNDIVPPNSVVIMDVKLLAIGDQYASTDEADQASQGN